MIAREEQKVAVEELILAYAMRDKNIEEQYIRIIEK